MSLMPPPFASDEDFPDLIIHELTQLRAALQGLSTAQAASRPTVSALSLSGLALHSAQVVHGWLLAAERAPEPVAAQEIPQLSARIGFSQMYAGSEDLGHMPADEVLAQLDRVIDFVRTEGPGLFDLAVDIPLGDHQWPGSGPFVTGRWVWQHLATEVARHAGHADILRESIDGASAAELTAAEG